MPYEDQLTTKTAAIKKVLVNYSKQMDKQFSPNPAYSLK